jgi:hypothetical protein
VGYRVEYFDSDGDVVRKSIKFFRWSEPCAHGA